MTARPIRKLDLDETLTLHTKSAEGSPTRDQRFYTPAQSPSSPPKSTTAAATSPVYFTPPTSSKPSSNDQAIVSNYDEDEYVGQYVFEESKSGRGKSSSGSGFADVAEEVTDLTELD